MPRTGNLAAASSVSSTVDAVGVGICLSDTYS